MKQDHRWLAPYAEHISGKSVLELGAGPGIDTTYLRALTSQLTATDLQANAGLKIQELDHSKPLPFKPCQFDIIVASLCLHYFSSSTTVAIISQIRRTLKPNGCLIARVNSVNDVNYGSVGHAEIEPGLFLVNDVKKRFFTEPEIKNLFNEGWQISELTEKTIDRYQKPKTIFEFSAVKDY